MAKALRFHAVVRGKALPLPDLSAFEGKRVEVIVLAEEDAAEQGSNTTGAPSLRDRVGALQGKVVVHGSFDDPLPDDVAKYFEGRGDEVDE